MAVILIVDDEPSITNLLAALLEDEGHQVSTASNGREGLAHLEKVKPDLVLSDVMMPILDGRALCQAMHANPSYQAIPIILMSAAIEGNISSECKYAAFLKKPFNLDTVLELVGKVTDNEN
jgi:two-component system alkaline phosphatase synthesis response regulator PhoP